MGPDTGGRLLNRRSPRIALERLNGYNSRLGVYLIDRSQLPVSQYQLGRSQMAARI